MKTTEIQQNVFFLFLIASFLYAFNLQAQLPIISCNAEANGNPYQICQYSELKLHTIELNGQQGSYYWTGPNNFQSGQQDPVLANITTLYSGMYNVTFTNLANQTATCAVNVQIRDCCQDPNSPSNFVTGPLTQLIPINFSLPIVCNDLYLDDNFSFPDFSNIILTDEISGTAITVNSGKVLTLNNSAIHGCNGVHKGIVIEPEAKANISDCLFEYGTHMIIAKGSSGLTVKNSHFHANHIAIDVPAPLDPTNFQLVEPFDLSGNTFDCTNDYVPEGYTPFCGIRLHNLCSGINSGLNSFIDLHNGIILIDGNFTIGNCTFSNMSTHPLIPISGNGIYATAEHTELNSLRLHQMGLGKTGPFSIMNCVVGINVNNVDVTIEENNMTNVNTGVYGNSFYGKQVYVKNNHISCHDQGIFIRNYFPARMIDLSLNTINIYNPSQDNFESAGIKLYEGLQDNFESSNIFMNKVFVQNAFTGIIINQCLKPKVHENQIMLLDFTTNITGIKVLSCEKANVSCNYLTGTDPAQGNSSSFNPTGIRVTSTTGSHINCNYLKDLYCGLNIEEICLDTEIKGNIFKDHSVGLRYNPLAHTGPQTDKGNQWLNPSMLLGAKYESNTPNQDAFRTDFNDPFLTPDNIDPQNNWFFPSVQQAETCNSTCRLWDTELIFSSINNFDSLIAIQGITSSVYEDEINWASGRYLFQKILKDTIQYSGSLFQQYYDSIVVESGGLFEQLKQTKTNAWKTDSVSITSLIALYDATATLLDSIKELDSLLSSGLNFQDSVQTGILLQSAVVSYNSINTQIYVLLNLIRSQANNTLDSLRIMNLSMSDSLVYQENEKKVNEILLSILSNGNDSLTPNEIIILEAVAAQCPVSGGLSVYMARSLLSGFFDTYYNDQLLCLQNGIVKNSECLNQVNSNITFSVKPTPSNGYLTLICSESVNIDSKYSLFDLTGRLILNNSINLINNPSTINLTDLADGIYYLLIKPTGMPASIHKIILVK